MRKILFLSLVLISSITYLVVNEQEEVMYSEIGQGQYMFLDPEMNIESDDEIQDFPQNLQSKENDPNLYKGACINGKDPATLTPEQILAEFQKGPCSPVVMVPGFISTSLRVQIDCQTLKKENPQIFHGCGWRTCSFYRSPQSQYRIWISSILSPMRTFQFKRSATCLGDLINLNRNSTQPDLLKRYTSPNGVKITFYGNTPKTQKDSQCGANALQYIGSKSQQTKQKASCSAKGWGPLIETLESMGYQTGVTYQAVPYDWRLDLVASQTQLIIPKSIKSLYAISGKKVVVFGHSFGTVHSLFSLTYQMTQAEKDLMVASYIPMGPVFLGSPSVMRTNIGGDNENLFKIWQNFRVGIQFYTQNLLVKTPSGFDMFPKDTFERFRNSPWMDLIKKRIQYEKDPTKFAESEIPLDFFPRTGSGVNCGSFESRPNGLCQTGIDDWSQNFFLKIANNTFNGTVNDLLESFKYSIAGDVLQEMYKESLAAKIDYLLNPGVPMIIYYTNLFNTTRDFVYYVNPKQIVEESQNYYAPNEEHQAAGDETVLSTSSLVPGIQWGWEFENVQGNSKPVRFLQLCSGQNLVNDIYDQTQPTGFQQFSQNGYNGLQCSCPSGGATTSCKHSCLHNEPNFLNFASKLVQTYQKSSSNDFKAKSLTTAEILAIQNSCDNLVVI